MSDSILDSVKKVCNIDPSYTQFDDVILLHINTVFSTLNQLGVGPDAGFMIEDNTVTWDAFVGTDLSKNNIKTYMGLCVRVIFDPPPSSWAVQAMQQQIEEFTWRISTNREGVSWTDPDPTPQPPALPWWETL